MLISPRNCLVARRSLQKVIVQGTGFRFKTIQERNIRMSKEAMAPEKRTVTGSCHCKAIKYEAKIPADFKSVTKCNCTMCQKPGFVTISLPPSGEDFHLISPKDMSQVGDYVWRNKDCHRYFCDKCGIQVWGKGKYEFGGNNYEFFSVNLNTLDQPQEGIDLSELSVAYMDGLTDNWMSGTKEKPFPGGGI